MTQRFPLLVCATAFLLAPLSSHAQSPGVQGTAEREILRRQQVVDGYAQNMINSGAAAMTARDYESAFAYYRAAVDALPLGGPNVKDIRQSAVNGFSDAAMNLARQRISEGRFEDAGEIVETLLDDRYNPNFSPALTLQAQLKDPAFFNRSITPGFVANVEEVKRLLTEAEGFYQSGRFDLSFRRYEQVLNIDKYNIAARRGMERVNVMRQRYADTAYNESRAQMITDVEKGWELPVRRYDLGVSTIIEQPQIDLTGTSSINRKLDEIRIPQVNFNDASVREAIDFIKRAAVQYDTMEPDPARRGVNIVLKLDPAAQAAELFSTITISLNDVPLRQVLEYIAQAANLKLKVEPFAVAIVPLTEVSEVLITKRYKVPPTFFSSLPSDPQENAGAEGRRLTTKEMLSAIVPFPDGAFAQYVPSSSVLIIRNTPSSLDIIDSLVEGSLSSPPSQIEIQSKFLEVTQNNLQELGLDWLVGQFALPGGSGVFGSGGTGGNQGGSPNTAFPQGTGVPFLPYGANDVNVAGNIQSGQITAGTRNGSAAIRANALDGLLFGSPVGPAPGILALAGVFTNPQFQVVLRALDQAKGVDLMSAPTVTTMDGQTAIVEVVREFIYPETYSPPTVPDTQTVGVINPATPATPESWKMEPVGVYLEVRPQVDGDGFTINLDLEPRVVEFEGFINYGSPISTTASIYALGAGLLPLGTRSVVLTENRIDQPVFSYRQVKTSVSIYDGQTVALGGLIREDVQKVEDKVPIIGDIPIVGRAFRTTADQHIKRNLLIFVTVNLIDPAGQPLIQIEEDGQTFAEPSAELYSDEILPGDASSIAPQL